MTNNKCLSTKLNKLLGYELDCPGFAFRWGYKIFFSSPKRQERLWGPPKLPIQWVPGFLPGVKQPGGEVEHSPTSSAEAKNE